MRSAGGKGGLWFGRIFTLPHTVIGIGAAGYLLFMILWALVGSDVPGVVIGTDITHSSKSGDHFILKYRYHVGAETKSGSGSVPEPVYQRFESRELTNVTVHYFALGSLEHAELDRVLLQNIPLPEGGGGGPVSFWAELKDRTSSIWGLLLWATFWNAVIALAVFQLWIKPVRCRLLYKHGAVAAGKVISKRVKTGKTSTYYVSYVFTDPVTGISISTETEVADEAAWKKAANGESVTVLYAANKPKRSTLYEYGGYYCLD